jgi:hypothetical protein
MHVLHFTNSELIGPQTNTSNLDKVSTANVGLTSTTYIALQLDTAANGIVTYLIHSDLH